MNIPKAPRRNCKKASVWKTYYERMATWYQDAADVLVRGYPSAAETASNDAARYREGATLIVNRTHPKIVSGEWQ